jgi:hypothetical protein
LIQQSLVSFHRAQFAAAVEVRERHRAQFVAAVEVRHLQRVLAAFNRVREPADQPVPGAQAHQQVRRHVVAAGPARQLHAAFEMPVGVG